MREWNAQEMRELFEKKAKEKGCSFTSFLKQFVDEMDVSNDMHWTTLRRYLSGEGEPTKSSQKQALYEKIETDFGYDMQVDVPKDSVYYLEDTWEKVPLFCQEYLDIIFEKIYEYIEGVYQGQYSFLFENDFNYFWFNYMLCKPLLPNYVCTVLEKLFNKITAFVKEELEKEEFILFEGVGIMYKDKRKECEQPNVKFCKNVEDYIETNLEAYRERVCTVFEVIAIVWEKRVEVLYPKESDTVKKARERFQKLKEANE